MNPDDVERLLGSPLLPQQRRLLESLGSPVLTPPDPYAEWPVRSDGATRAEVLAEGWKTIGYTTEGVGFLPSPTASETRETVSSNLTAYLIRSTNSELELATRWAETLILPLAVPTTLHATPEQSEVAAVYTRTTNGSKGRGNSWVQEAPEENVLDKIFDHRVIGKVDLTLSDAEAEALASNDIKALATRIAHQPLTANKKDIGDLLSDLRLEAWGQIEKARAADADAAAALAVEQADAVAEQVAEVFDSNPGDIPSLDSLEAGMGEYPIEHAVHTVAPHGHAVAVEIPSGPTVDGYVGRTIATMTDSEVFDLAAEEHMNVLLIGDTGSGKTTAVRSWAAKHNHPCYVIPGNGPLDPSALFGRFIPDPVSGTFEWIDGPVTTVLRLGGVLVIDEINMIPAKVLSVLYPLLDGRREIPLLDHSGEVVHAHPDVVVFATQNEGMGYSGTSPLSHAIKNRFSVILRWGYDPAVEKQLITSKTLLTFAERIRVMHQAGEVETPTTTNSLMTFERISRKTGNLNLAIETMLNRYASDSTERAAVQVVFDGLKANVEGDLWPAPAARAISAPVGRVSPRLRLKAAVAADDVWGTDDDGVEDELTF